MTIAQKIIKYLAIALAISIIVSIFSAIAGGIFGLASVLGLRRHKSSGELKEIDFENSQVATLDIDVAFTNLTIKTGDTLKAETNNSNINCKQNYQNLQIKEKSHKWFGNNGEGDLVVYVPKNIEFETIRINAGAGKINIEELNTKELVLNLGAGNTEISSVNVSKKCNIDGGVGKLRILSGTITNLDLDIGIGQTDLVSEIRGKSNINSGIGKVNIKLLGHKDIYNFKINKGIGTIKIAGEEMVDGQKWGNGTGFIDSYIDIDGGIGEIKIDF